MGSIPTSGSEPRDAGKEGVMPKEIIKSSEPLRVYLENADGTEGSVEYIDRFQAELGWNREADYVQLITVTTDPRVDLVNRGFAVQLDRAGINRLIKALRKARTQVFGKDE